MNFKNWSAIRIIRLVLAIVLAYDAIAQGSWIWLILVAYLLYQVIVNKQCNCGDSCVTAPNNKKID